MKYISYIIDPAGDVELLLKQPNSQQLIPFVRSHKSDKESEDPMNEPRVARGVPLDARYHVFDDLLSPTKDEEDPDPHGTITWGSRSVALAEENAIKVRTTLEGEVRMRVSSRHLILASPFFRSALEGPWRSRTSSFFGKPLRQIIAYKWDAVAFALVLDIIHGRHRGVPRSVDIMLLTRIATIVDFYHCQEVVQIFADHWYGIDNLLWSEYSSRTLMWLFISWVFSGEEAFNKATEMTLGHMDDHSNIDTKELNLNGILTKINGKRQELINEIVAALHNLRDTLPHSDFLCDWHKYDSPTCSSIALGILERELERLGSSDRPLVGPFHGYSIMSMIQLVNDIPESIAATTEEYDHYHDVSVCSVRGRMRHVLGDVKAELDSWTLDLDKNVRGG
ncbi:hypothetical protein FPHYL_299 [Fusarium phyllophilum]|uniref:BTB domain-containing protein n=1 Tax=Fusarium phyllophilum TaxID=47803 RepID=A0A8H5NM25_9HYPO|nr:hypothetical protein FPHYL_299 [Fusarium phyllophilum]